MKKPEKNLEKNYIISIDMGGTKILSAVVNSELGVIVKLKQSTGKGNSTFYLKKLVSIIDETVKEAKIKPEQVKAVCIGIPGSVNPFSGKINVAPNLNIKNYPLKEKLQKFIPYEVIIENDVNLAALGIKYFGLGKDAKNMLVIFIGTGIGSGLIFDNKIFRGTNFAAGEVGHIEVFGNNNLCGCGKRGCIEAIASRTAIVKGIIRDYRKGNDTVLGPTIEKRKPIKSKALKKAVKDGDKVVTAHIVEACEKIGFVLSGLNNFLNVDLIVLGGGVIEALEKFMLPIIKESMKKHSLELAGKNVKVVATKLKDEAPLFGGIALVEEFLGIKI